MNFGFRASIPHLGGVCIGFFLMMVAIGTGFGVVVTQVPVVYSAIKWLGAAYLLYLAWRIARTPAGRDNADNRRPAKPLGFFGAAMFQWVDPKGWAMTVSCLRHLCAGGTQRLDGARRLLARVRHHTALHLGIDALGARLRDWLGEPRRARLFNRSMAALLVASLVPMLRPASGS